MTLIPRERWTITPRAFKEKRLQLGLTQAELAAKLQVHTQTVSQWETGVRPILEQTRLALNYLLAVKGCPPPG